MDDSFLGRHTDRWGQLVVLEKKTGSSSHNNSYGTHLLFLLLLLYAATPRVRCREHERAVEKVNLAVSGVHRRMLGAHVLTILNEEGRAVHVVRRRVVGAHVAAVARPR